MVRRTRQHALALVPVCMIGTPLIVAAFLVACAWGLLRAGWSWGSHFTDGLGE